MNKLAIKSYLTNSLKASIAISVSMIVDEDFRNAVSDKIIRLSIDKNKETYKAQVVSPVAFMTRLSVRNLADTVEMLTIYDLDECTSKSVRDTLGACLNIVALGTQQSVADVLNITKDDGSLPTICDRILLAFARYTEEEDSPVSVLLDKTLEYFKNIAVASIPSEVDTANLFNTTRYGIEDGKVILKQKFTDADVSPFDENYKGPDF